jgi:hypothetical protein
VVKRGLIAPLIDYRFTIKRADSSANSLPFDFSKFPPQPSTSWLCHTSENIHTALGSTFTVTCVYNLCSSVLTTPYFKEFRPSTLILLAEFFSFSCLDNEVSTHQWTVVLCGEKIRCSKKMYHIFASYRIEIHLGTRLKSIMLFSTTS